MSLFSVLIFYINWGLFSYKQKIGIFLAQHLGIGFADPKGGASDFAQNPCGGAAWVFVLPISFKQAWVDRQNKKPTMYRGFWAHFAETEGFEPSKQFPVYTLSKRAPSTTRTNLLRWIAKIKVFTQSRKIFFELLVVASATSSRDNPFISAIFSAT